MNADYSAQYIKAEELHWWWVARRCILRYFFSRILTDSKKKQFNRVLEIGCFTGKNISALKEYSREWFGIEPSISAAETARLNTPYAHIVTGNFPDVALDNKFDVVCMFDVLEHIEHSESSLCVIANMLEDSGRLILTVPAYQWLWSEFDVQNHHFRRYTRKQLTTELRKAGFKIDYISYYNTFLFLPAALQRLIKKCFGETRNDSDTAIPQLLINKLLTKIFESEKFILRHIRFPFGLSLIAIAHISPKR